MKTSGVAPARRPAAGKLFAALNRYSLKSLLIGSAGLVVLYCVLVAVAVQVSQGRTLSLMDRLINVDNVVSDLCLKSTAAMTDARRLEKDFLLNYREYGFDESRSRYITRLITRVAEIKGHLERIRQLADDPETSRTTLELEGALDRYRQGVELLAEKHGERGTPDTGIYGAMRAEAQGMEQLARRGGADVALLSRILSARRAERYYVEREKDSDVLAVADAVRALDAAAAGLPPGPRAEFRERARRYLGSFERYVRATEEIWATKRGYLRSVQTIDPLLEQLYVAALGRVTAKRRAIERNNRLLVLPVIAAGGVVLVVTAFFAFGIPLAVTRSVLESKGFAERIAAGDLGERLVPVGRNEFSALATALNSLAQSLHEADVARRSGTDALRESEEKYRSFVESSSDWIWALDREGRHTFSNERVRDILGLGPEELLASSAFDLLHPDDVPKAREVLERGLATGAGWHGVELRWRHRDGTYRWVESNAAAATDARGALVGFRGVDRDITERKRLESELIKAQKLEAIGTLAGGIAHDFNNLLQGLFGYISLARLNLGRGEKAGAMLEQAEKALTLSVNLTTQLLTFAKGGQPVKRTIAVAPVLEDAAKFALSGSRSDHRVAADPGLWAVDADEGQLSQVFQNLVRNASEAMPQGGVVEIAARNEVVAPGDNALVPSGGSYVRVDVKDSGAGIAVQDLTRIFDPYFTTKQRGSGLGLATSYSIVRSHDGFIDVTSHVGEGSVFSVYLPARLGGASPDSRPDAGRGGGRGGRILVMDDERIVREVAVAMLPALGFDVATASSGEEALELYRRAGERGSPFDAVILDLTVKNGMGGEETLLRLRELNPDVKAVVSSGYADAPAVDDYRSHGFAARLNKPYRMEALRECLFSLFGTSGLQGPGSS